MHSWEELEKALDEGYTYITLTEPSEGGDTLIATSSITISDGVTIDTEENGITITVDDSVKGALFTVEDDCELTLEGAITVEPEAGEDLSAGFLTVEAGGTATLEGSITVAEGATATESLIVCSGTLVMGETGEDNEKVKVSGFTASDVSSDPIAAVFVTGVDAEFTMNGGTISGNTADNGGGVYVENGVVEPLGEGLQLCSNTAWLEEDDLYCINAAVLQNLPDLPADVELECGHAIDGWYLDGASSRWSVAGCGGAETTNAQKYSHSPESAGAIALKAAHGAVEHEVTIESTAEGGTVSATPSPAAEGDTVTLTAAPEEGYQLTDLTVTDESGDEIKVTDNGDGTYTFTMPGEKVTVTPVFAKKTYGLTADPGELDFGQTWAGEPAPAGQTVTLTNTGDQPLTVTLPTAAGYTVTAGDGGWSGDTVTIQPGNTATFTVQPSGGLAPGRHDGTLTVTGTDGEESVTAQVDLRFGVNVYIPPVPSYLITIADSEDGAVTSSHIAAMAGSTVTLTVTPEEGYELAALTVTDFWGREVALTANGDGTYAFPMPASQVEVAAVFTQAEKPELPFLDVTEADWFYDEVYYVWESGLMQGTGETSFGPGLATTRAQVVTILYRLEGEPTVTGDNPFTDAQAGWYADAVLWASQKGIVNGYTDTVFGAEDAITREQLAAILYRYAQYKGYDVTAAGDLSGFADAAAVSPWAEEALSWAVGEKLIQGSANQIDPAGAAIRAQLAAILTRFCENVAR